MDVIGLLSLALGLGMLHALDADHVAAVAGLSCRKGNLLGERKGLRNASVRFCLQWAAGHGASLIIIGTAVMFLGMAIPETLSHYAESLVGVVLLVIGSYVIWDILRQKAHIHFHTHDDMPRHAHWHAHKKTGKEHNQVEHQHSHAPVFVGVLHGIAGSAPLLALLPISQLQSPWQGLLYLLLFGLGVMFAMLLFGGVLGQAFSWLQRYGNNMVNGLRGTVALLAIGLGGHLILVSV